jgi:hypothetical protein
MISRKWCFQRDAAACLSGCTHEERGTGVQSHRLGYEGSYDAVRRYGRAWLARSLYSEEFSVGRLFAEIDISDLLRLALTAWRRPADPTMTVPISTNLILAYIGQHVLGMPRSY